ncbi:MAG: hypothetical protein WCX65_11305, partial [bacterium]
PYEKPRLTFAVFAENGGHGSSDALPIAERVIKLALKLGYFGDDYKPKPASGDAIKNMEARTKKILD